MRRPGLIPVLVLLVASLLPMASDAQVMRDSSSIRQAVGLAFSPTVLYREGLLNPPRPFSIREEAAAVWRRSPAVTSFFCRNELLLERKSILAPRFRLGSLAYTEWMEGKRASYRD